MSYTLECTYGHRVELEKDEAMQRRGTRCAMVCCPGLLLVAAITDDVEAPHAVVSVGTRFLIWVSGEREEPEVGSAPWWEQPFVIVAGNPIEAILAVLHSGQVTGRDVDLVTATRLPADYVAPPLGPSSEPTS